MAEDLEIFLRTKMQKPEVYLTRLYVPSSEHDWRYFEDLREVFAFDLSHNGFTEVRSLDQTLDESLHFPDVRSGFDMALWKKVKTSYVFAIQAIQNRFQLIVFDINKGSSKKYPEFALSGKLEADRSHIHRLSDTVQKDLFGIQGIASLKILYSQRAWKEDRWESEIWISDSDGANAHPLVQEEGYCVTPGAIAASSDGGFYYISYREGQSKIYRSSLKKMKGEPMLSLRGSQVLPAMNPAGTQIAFISDAAGRPDLFIQNLDPQGGAVGKARQLFSSPRATQASPTYNPDGIASHLFARNSRSKADPETLSSTPYEDPSGKYLACLVARWDEACLQRKSRGGEADLDLRF
jgi:TolB protein